MLYRRRCLADYCLLLQNRQSTGEARRQIKGGGIKVNDKPVTNERQLLTPSDLTPDGVIKLSLGKKRHALIRPV